MKLFTAHLWIILAMTGNAVIAQSIDEFKYNNTFDPGANTVISNFQFNGYTNYWHDVYRDWVRYGNLFKIAVPKVDYTIAQSKVDIADDMGIPGLTVQEGFVNGLLDQSYAVLD
ncbi:MAG TPA: hypothetical protein VI583_01300, partial [Cyclobacteriaceae bacterium]|nr:hypothetical protein [Cyclobacteriaceae bacterium]